MTEFQTAALERRVKKTKERIARETADYERLRGGDSAVKQKTATLMDNALYISVSEDTRDDVYELLRFHRSRKPFVLMSRQVIS